MPQDFSEISFLIVTATILVLLMTAFIIFMVFLHRNRQLRHQQALLDAHREYEEAVTNARLEMHENTLNHISRELHDNIGQVLSFIKLSLNTSQNLNDQERQHRIEESKDLISQVINDIKDLSKSFSLQQISKLGLAEAIKNESERVSNSGIMEVNLAIDGQPYRLGEEEEVLLFRIFQEGMNNAIKYSGTNNLQAALNYGPDLFTFSLRDDGVGFDAQAIQDKNGSGLFNIKARTVLLGANVTINSTPGHGCAISLSLKAPGRENENEKFADSISR